MDWLDFVNMWISSSPPRLCWLLSAVLAMWLRVPLLSAFCTLPRLCCWDRACLFWRNTCCVTPLPCDPHFVKHVRRCSERSLVFQNRVNGSYGKVLCIEELIQSNKLDLSSNIFSHPNETFYQIALFTMLWFIELKHHLPTTHMALFSTFPASSEWNNLLCLWPLGPGRAHVAKTRQVSWAHSKTSYYWFRPQAHCHSTEGEKRERERQRAETTAGSWSNGLRQCSKRNTKNEMHNLYKI